MPNIEDMPFTVELNFLSEWKSVVVLLTKVRFLQHGSEFANLSNQQCT